MALGSMSSADETSAAASEMQTLVGISAAHLISHIYILTIPVLLPLFKTTFSVGFLELGLAITIFNVVSGLTQAPMGFAVDRIGARRVLMAGLLLGGLGFALLGASLSYGTLLVVAVLLGLANCVYHPADYAILSQSISEGRIGRAFSIHTFAGFLGSALAPVILLAVANWFGLRAALFTAAAIGPAVALVLLLLPRPLDRTATARKAEGPATGAAKPASVLNPTVLSLVLFFALLGLSGSAISNFSVVALMADKGMSLVGANAALTSYLTMSALGVLAGGYLADRTKRHGDVAAFGFGCTALFVLIVALFKLPPVLVAIAMGLGGFLSGMIMPSRDMLVRKASPPGQAGSVFGIVSTGFNIGGIVGPLLFGWIMDHAPPVWIFGAAIFFMVGTALYGFFSERLVTAPKVAAT